ncbi:MAG: hypothetical protein KDA61_00540 [Planctomycetales bacterium]|nr:hypothetical protein [Planctomycetales bacterium]
MRRFGLGAMLLSMALSAQASAATLLFDFGPESQMAPGNYNHILVDPASLVVADAIDSTGASTGIGLTASGFYAGANFSGTTSPSGDAAIFDAEATRDNAFGHDDAFGTNPLTPLATLALTGLDGSGATAYSFTFFGSRLGATDNRETMYNVLGANSGFGLLDTTANVDKVAVVSGIIPTAAGELTIEVSPGPNNDNGSGFYYIGAMSIESGAVPEPTAAALAALAGMALTRRRRS